MLDENTFNKNTIDWNNKILSVDSLLHYLAAERIGPQKGNDFGVSKMDVGCRGEFALYVMYYADKNKYLVNEELKLIKDSNRFSRQVEAWLNTIIPNISFKFEIIEKMNKIAIEYKNSLQDMDYVSPHNTGFGITYLLPIIISGLLLSAQKNSVLIVENPESHLHPFSQSKLGRFLSTLARNGIQVIVETHSDHLINGCRLEAVKHNSVNNLKINFIAQSEKNQIEAIEINEQGELSKWPDGFYDQEEKDMREMLNLRRQLNK